MTRKINQAGLDLVKSFEGLKTKAYYCPAGVLTIGYGHTGPDVGRGQKITSDEAEELLRCDMEEFEGYVEELITVPLTDNQFSALVSFTFNVGNGSLRSSTLRKKLNGGDYDAVPAEMARWNKHKNPKTGKREVSRGLARRRAAEAALWMTGKDDTDDMGDMPQAVADPGDERPVYEVTARSGLCLRGGPGKGFEPMTVMSSGTRLYAGKERDGWVEVDLEGDGQIDGWAYGSFLRQVVV